MNLTFGLDNYASASDALNATAYYLTINHSLKSTINLTAKHAATIQHLQHQYHLLLHEAQIHFAARAHLF